MRPLAILLLCAATARAVQLPFYQGSWSSAALVVPRTSDIIPGQYIVVFDNSDHASAAKLALQSATSSPSTGTSAPVFLNDFDVPGTPSQAAGGNGVVFTQPHSGFSLSCSPSTLDALASMGGLLAIEHNIVVSLNSTLATSAESMAAGVSDMGAVDGGVRRRLTTQTGVTWGLDRIDQPGTPPNSKYNYVNDGTGVRVYVLDTGIRYTHTEFGGRAVRGRDFITTNGDASDCYGHGTHVAGTIGGAKYGVAKKATLVSVRVLDCSGSGSLDGLLAAFSWVVNDQVAAGVRKVMSMSLSFYGRVDIVDLWELYLVYYWKIPVVVAAANFGDDACNYSPAGAPAAVTVAASTINNDRPSWSDYGPCVDMFAPGENVLSAWHTSNTATNTLSGTSMATPHVSGAVALLLQAHPRLDGGETHDTIKGNAVWGQLNDGTYGLGDGSPNLLLQTTGVMLCTSNADCEDNVGCSTDTCKVSTGVCSRTWSYTGSCCKLKASVCTAGNQCCSGKCTSGYCT